MHGEPDCYGLIVKYKHAQWGAAWCWSLTMPRGGKEVARGWASAWYTAKREVESAVVENWG
jgi:hypothetical protein